MSEPDVIAELIEAAKHRDANGSGSIVRLYRAIRACEAAGYPARRDAELRAIEVLAALVAERDKGKDLLHGALFASARAALRDLGLGEG